MKVNKEHRQDILAKNWYLPVPSDSTSHKLEKITDLSGSAVMWTPLKQDISGSYLILNFGFDERVGIAHYSYEEACENEERTFNINGFTVTINVKPNTSEA
jgi:hypothetical protein